MWIHISIMVVVLLAFIGYLRGWFRALDGIEEKSIRLFLLVAFAGNVLGAALTIQEEWKPAEDYKRLPREETGAYEEEFAVSVDGEKEETVRIQVPGKERPASEEAGENEEDFLPETESMKLSREIQDAAARYNQEIRDPDYYYLPESADGKSLQWSSPRDTSGQLLSALFLAGGLLIVMLGGREKRQKELDRQERMLLEYPPMIMKFTLLIQAGMSVRRAFRKMASDYLAEKKRIEKASVRHRFQKNARHYADEEILIVCNELESGVSEAEAYRHLGERCGQIRYRTFSTLLVQNLQKGSRSLGDILERESLDAWEERKRKARVAGETASTKLLFPMLLMLLVVMAVIMIPAFLAFWG